MSIHRQTITLRNDRAEIPRLAEFVDAFCAPLAPTPTDMLSLHLALEEAVTNVIIHAYHGEGDHSVELELRFTEEALEIHILHSGQGIRGDQLVLPDPKEYIKHPRKGGLGLLLMSRFMDEIRYIETGEGSECCMIKRVV